MVNSQQFPDTSPKSVRLNRPFTIPTWDQNANELQKALESAKEALHKTESAYKPSGQISTLTRIIMFLATLLVTLLIVVIIGLILLVYDYLQSLLGIQGRIGGWLAILVDGLVIVVMLTVAPWLNARMGKALKNRNARWSGILTLVSSFIVGIIYFWPIWEDGTTLTPTEISLLFIPLKWVIILIGGLIVPIISYLPAVILVEEQKFCETSGVFLRPMQKRAFPISWAEDLVELLTNKNYEQINNIHSASWEDIETKHFAELVLWWHEKAETAYLELTISFKGKARTKTYQEAKEKEVEEKWLAFSQRLSRAEAQSLSGQTRTGSAKDNDRERVSTSRTCPKCFAVLTEAEQIACPVCGASIERGAYAVTQQAVNDDKVKGLLQRFQDPLAGERESAIEEAEWSRLADRRIIDALEILATSDVNASIRRRAKSALDTLSQKSSNTVQTNARSA